MISDDVIQEYLDTLLGQSEPGQTLHHLLVAAAGAADTNPLGMPEPRVYVYVIAPVGLAGEEGDRFVAKTIVAAIADNADNQRTAYFAGLAMEYYVVKDDGTAQTADLVRRLGAEGKLEQHPAAVEVTRLYAACRDGRRWVGERVLTGPEAGTSDCEVRVGAYTDEEAGMYQRLVRGVVGLR